MPIGYIVEQIRKFIDVVEVTNLIENGIINL